jgi:hypothetical protein
MFTQRRLLDAIRRAHELAYTERSGYEEVEYARTLTLAVKMATQQPELLEGGHLTHNLGRKQMEWFTGLLEETK